MQLCLLTGHRRFLISEQAALVFPELMDMELTHQSSSRAERHREEIENAIDNAKRSKEDKWWRRQWYRAAGRRRRRELGLPVGRKHGTEWS